MANRWGNNGNNDRLYILGLQNDYRWLLQLKLKDAGLTNIDGVLKGRDITLLRKVCMVKAMIFPVAMYGCESWTIRKAEHQRIDRHKL